MIVRGASGTRSITVLKMQFPTDGRAGTFIMQEKLSTAEVLYQYQYLRDRTFLQAALAPVYASSKTILRLGEQVRTVQEEEDLVRIQTHQGTHAGRYVIDTRPMDQQNRKARYPDVHWLQHFMGWKVKTEHACFQSKQVTLMDFEGRKDAAEILGVNDNETDNALPGIPFIYLLPFSPTEALVESTWLGQRCCRRVSIENSYKDICKRRGGNYEIIEQEYGVLPMSTLPTTTQPTRRIRHLGWQVVQLVPVLAMRFWQFSVRHKGLQINY